MHANEQAILGLREALRVSPNNLPLRQTLADLLLGAGECEQAALEYKAALGLSPANRSLKFGLAQAYFLEQKHAMALVVVEDLIKQGEPAANFLLLYAKLLLASGDCSSAAVQYQKAVELDSSVADLEFNAQLERVGPGTTSPKARSGRKGSKVNNEAVEKKEGAEDEPSVTFDDVGGMDAVKEDIRIKIIHPLTHPELFKAYGKKSGGGILMYGPPGCGKTHLARATAGEINAHFMPVGISDVLDMWIGSSERNLHEIFEQARRRRPTVLFFDEVDALAASRSDMRASAGRHMINQFLAEMDGVSSNNEGVLMLAATNAPWHVDPAFRRPGRFDSILFVPPPDLPARATILRIHLSGKPVAELDFDEIARMTEGFSGADLRGLIESAVEAKLRQALKSGQVSPLVTEDLIAALEKVKPSTAEWFAAARNYAMYSNQAGTYDDVLKHLKM